MSTLLQETCEAVDEASCGLYAVCESLKTAAIRGPGGDIADYAYEGRLYLLNQIYERLQYITRTYREIESDLLRERNERSCHSNLSH
jgi:hypothetical protein